jgi:hypothetical protein
LTLSIFAMPYAQNACRVLRYSLPLSVNENGIDPPRGLPKAVEKNLFRKSWTAAVVYRKIRFPEKIREKDPGKNFVRDFLKKSPSVSWWPVVLSQHEKSSFTHPSRNHPPIRKWSYPVLLPIPIHLNHWYPNGSSRGFRRSLVE